MMIPIPVRIETYNENCGVVPYNFCRNCGCPSGVFYKIKNKTTTRVMFVPFMTVTNATYLRCGSCAYDYQVSKKGFDRIASSADVHQALDTQEIARQKKKENYCEAGFSPKNQVLAVILAMFLTTLGAPFFYIGKPLLGILCLAFSFLTAWLELFPVMMVIPMVGFVFAFLLATGKVKDKNGRYIVSKRQREELMR